ncbi:MAG: ribonuclease HI family protein [Patescibacteria group bacterium]|nr:ribonuclease HI family protein [Patescibacteria group bacterium]
MNNILIFTDGGARGNPGPAAIGVYVVDDKGNKLAAIGKRIGEATNNAAEYKAVLEAFSWLTENKQNLEKNAKISFFLDSQLVYSQIKGLFKVKAESIREYIFTIREKEKNLGLSLQWNHIPREQNKMADSLVNLALDNLL